MTPNELLEHEHELLKHDGEVNNAYEVLVEHDIVSPEFNDIEKLQKADVRTQIKVFKAEPLVAVILDSYQPFALVHADDVDLLNPAIAVQHQGYIDSITATDEDIPFVGMDEDIPTLVL